MTSIINTKRIVLKKFTENDVDLLFELDSDPEVMKYITLGKTKTLNEVKNKFMPRVMQSYKNGKDYGIFSAYLITNNSFIGWFQFEPDKSIKDAVEIGWRLKKECWGNGYATEALSSVV